MSAGKQCRRQSQEENQEEGSRTFSFRIVEEEEAMSSTLSESPTNVTQVTIPRSSNS